jgi:hypothetical protein
MSRGTRTERKGILFHEPGHVCGYGGVLFHDNLFCCKFGPDLLGKVFSNLVRMHEVRKDFGRDSGILVHKSCLKFDLQDLCAVLISHGAQDPGFNG